MSWRVGAYVCASQVSSLQCNLPLMGFSEDSLSVSDNSECSVVWETIIYFQRPLVELICSFIVASWTGVVKYDEPEPRLSMRPKQSDNNMKLLGCFILSFILLQAYSEALSTANAVASLSNVHQEYEAGLQRRYHPRKINCNYACARRCSRSSRKNLCNRACKSCCFRCHCVPPGTSGNENSCPCYANLKTHGNKHKCP